MLSFFTLLVHVASNLLGSYLLEKYSQMLADNFFLSYVTFTFPPIVLFQAKAVLKSSTLLQRLLIVEGQLKKNVALTAQASPQVNKCCLILSNLQILIQD